MKGDFVNTTRNIGTCDRLDVEIGRFGIIFHAYADAVALVDAVYEDRSHHGVGAHER